MKILFNLNGKQQMAEVGIGGGVTADAEIVWNDQKDGPFPIKIDLGYMERVERIELVKDANGKQLYDIKEIGEHKTQRVKIPIEQKVVYLLNKKLGKRAPSQKRPERVDK